MAFFKPKANPYYDDVDYVSEEENEMESTPVAEQEEPVGVFGGLNLGGSNIELKVLRPEKFADAPQVADHLLSGRTVVLTLENTDKDTSRHLIDFLSGVTYAIDGTLRKIANDIFVITPSNVAVSESQLTSADAEEEDEPQPIGFTSDEE